MIEGPRVRVAALVGMVAFFASAAATAQVVASPSAVGFGSQPVGVSTPASIRVVVTNGGATPADLQQLTAPPGVQLFPGAPRSSNTTDDFFYDGGTCQQTGAIGAQLIALAAGHSCVLAFSFRPLSFGLKSATVTIATSAGPVPIALSGTGGTPAAPLTLSPTAFSFGDVAVGQWATRVFTLSNITASPVNVLAFGTGLGLNGFGYGRTGGTCPAFPDVLAGNTTCTLFITFMPVSVLTLYSGELGFVTDQGSVRAPLLGRGVTGAPRPTANPSTVAFGTQTLFAFTPASLTATISNVGATSVDLGFMTGPPGVEVFPGRPRQGNTSDTFFFDGGTCFDPAGFNTLIVLPAGQSCTVQFSFRPHFTGPMSGVATLDTDAGPVTILLTGSGGAPSVPVTLSPVTHEFGVVVVGGTATATFTLSNVSSSAVNLLGFGTGIYTSAIGFTRTGGTCPIPGSLGPNASCTFDVTFSPTSVTPYQGDLGVITEHGSVHAPLSGVGVTGAAVPFASRAAVDFGPSIVGAFSDGTTVTITNPNGAPLGLGSLSATPGVQTMSGPPREGNTTDTFFVYGGTCNDSIGVGHLITLGAGQSCTLILGVRPTSPGAKSGTLFLNTNAGPVAVALAASGMYARIPASGPLAVFIASLLIAAIAATRLAQRRGR